jgi:hypothetical protein
MSKEKQGNVVEMNAPQQTRQLTRAQEAFRNVVQLAQMGFNGECAIVAAALEKTSDTDD